jgi:hypothetical protein
MLRALETCALLRFGFAGLEKKEKRLLPSTRGGKLLEFSPNEENRYSELTLTIRIRESIY